MNPETLLHNAAPFLRWLAGWESARPSLRLAELAADPGRLALISVDIINGFCHQGPLASPRVRGIIAPSAHLLERAHAAGVRHFVLTQDTHAPEAVEFAQYPPHCVRGTDESQSVPEFQSLPFYPQMTILPKNSISSAQDTGLEAWLQAHPEVDTFITIGDCTDLCTYQLAMHLRLRANARQLRQRVILPIDCVDTYDLPVEAARPLGALPHDADLLHLVFLYSMALNGVEVVRTVA